MAHTLSFFISPTDIDVGGMLSYYGQLLDDFSTPVPGVTVELVCLNHPSGGPVTVDTQVTNIAGMIWNWFFYPDWCGGTFNLRLECESPPLTPVVSVTRNVDIHCAASLKSGFFVLPYRTPSKIEDRHFIDYSVCKTLDQDSGRSQANADRIYVPSTLNFTIGEECWVYDDDNPKGEVATISNIIVDDYLEVSSDLSKDYETAQNARVCRITGDERGWGGILCIDPNSLRSDNKGPIFFLLDTLLIRPGLTDKNGVFQATILDVHDENREFDMMLFAEDTPFIRDNDEFWVGLQEGPDVPNDPSGLMNNWLSGLGGRKWIMGGTLCKRYYSIDDQRRITAYIEGKCYMDIWHDNYFGTDQIPRDYKIGAATDFANIAGAMRIDYNAVQPAEWAISASPSLYPGVGAIPNVTGVEWLKEFKEEEMFKVMKNGCEEAGWEWNIVPYPAGTTPAGRRVLQLFPREPPGTPLCLQPLIEYDRNIRNVRRIMMGDTTEIVTHVIVTDNEITPLPDPTSTWCRELGLWLDLINPNRMYNIISAPAPPNPKKGIWADSSLVLDDEGSPALCFMKDSLEASYFIPFLALYRNDAGDQVAARLRLDLREWRRIKFKFRHITYDAAHDVGNAYKILLHTGTALNDFYLYEFGLGPGLSPQLTADLTNHDTINDDEWTEIDILLPEIDDAGVVIPGKEFGWEGPTGTTDLREVMYVSFSWVTDEPMPGPHVIAGKKYIARIGLSAAASSGDRYISVSNPEVFVGYPVGTAAGEQYFNLPQPYYLIHQGGTSEEIQVHSINTPECPPGTNTRLDAPLQNNYGSSGYIYCRGGFAFSLAEFHFLRALKYEQLAPDPIGPPWRFKIMTKKEMEMMKEATSYEDQAMLQEAIPKRFIISNLDGDPRYLIGHAVSPRFDTGAPGTKLTGPPYREKIFQNIPMIIDDIEYRVIDIDFTVNITLGRRDSRTRILDELNVLQAQKEEIRNLQKGKARVQKGYEIL